jgi:hypothetical protein
LLPRLFFTTGDIILREEKTPYIEDTLANWDAMDAQYDVLKPEEVRYRWPWIRFENLGIGVYEPDAGVVRARRAMESVASSRKRAARFASAGRLSPVVTADSSTTSGSIPAIPCRQRPLSSLSALGTRRPSPL